MTDKQKTELAINVAETIDKAIVTGTLDLCLRGLSLQEWKTYVIATKQVLDSYHQDIPDDALKIGAIYNGVVKRKEKLLLEGLLPNLEE